MNEACSISKAGAWFSRLAGLAWLTLFLWGPALRWPPALSERPWALIAAGCLGLLALLPGVHAKLARLPAALTALPRRRFYALLFVGGLAIYATSARYVFDGIPRIDDGVGSLFQARLFARGHLVFPPPPLPNFFRCFSVLSPVEGVPHWCGMYPPGWPALLLPGVWLGVPWLVNPVLAAAMALVIAELGRLYFNDLTGRVAGLLGLSSPLLAALAGLHVSHVATAFMLAGCLLCAKHMLLAPRQWWWGALAGGAWGWAFLCRPVDALAVGAIFAVFTLWDGAWYLPRYWKPLAAALGMAVLAAGLMLAFQAATTTDPFTPGHKLGMGPRGKFGFVRLDHVRTHTPAIGWFNTTWRLAELNEDLLGWPLPALLLPLLPFLLGRARRTDWLLLLPVPALLAAFACYWYYDHCLPGRYISAAIPFFFVQSAHGLETLFRAAPHGPRGGPRLLTGLLSGCVLFGMLAGVPSHFARYGDYYFDVEDILPRVIRDYNIHHALVFMDELGLGFEADNENDYYATGFMRNDLELRGDVIYARNLREKNHLLAQEFPGRNYYLYRYHRTANRGLLYRMEFEGEAMRLTPIQPRTPDLLWPG